MYNVHAWITLHWTERLQLIELTQYNKFKNRSSLCIKIVLCEFVPKSSSGCSQLVRLRCTQIVPVLVCTRCESYPYEEVPESDPHQLVPESYPRKVVPKPYPVRLREADSEYQRRRSKQPEKLGQIFSFMSLFGKFNSKVEALSCKCSLVPALA